MVKLSDKSSAEGYHAVVAAYLEIRENAVHSFTLCCGKVVGQTRCNMLKADEIREI